MGLAELEQEKPFAPPPEADQATSDVPGTVEPFDAQAREREAERASIRRYRKRLEKVTRTARNREDFKEKLRALADEIAPQEPEPVVAPSNSAPAAQPDAAPAQNALAEVLAKVTPEDLAGLFVRTIDVVACRRIDAPLDATEQQLLTDAAAPVLKKWLGSVATSPEAALLGVAVLLAIPRIGPATEKIKAWRASKRAPEGLEELTKHAEGAK